MHPLELAAVKAIRGFVRENKEAISLISGWGDGRCGYIAEVICEELGISKGSTKAPARPSVSKRKKSLVFDALGESCLRCGCDEDICIDHIIPLSIGGSNDTDNMQPLCRSCNSIKGVNSTDYRNKKPARK